MSSTGATLAKGQTALDRLRPAHPDGLRRRSRTGARRGGQGRRPVPTAETCGPARRHPLNRMNTSMTINATAADLAITSSQARRPGSTRPTSRHDAERHHQEYLSRGPTPSQPPRRSGSSPTWWLHRRGGAALQPDQHLSYHLKEAGARPFRRSPTRCRPPSRCSRGAGRIGDDPELIGPGVRRISFFVNAGVASRGAREAAGDVRALGGARPVRYGV